MKLEKVGDIVEIAKGKKAPFSSSTFNTNLTRYIQIEDLRSNDKLQYTDDPKGVYVNNNDICLAWDGANAGTIGYNLEGIIGSTIARLRIKKTKLDYIFPAYIGKYLQSKFSFLNKSSNGVTIPHIDKNKLLNLTIPIPSLSEQKRISAILDKVDGIIHKRKQSIKLLDELVKANFVEMFGDIEINNYKFPTKKGSDLFKFSSGKFLPEDKRLKEGIPVYGGNGIVWYTDKALIDFPTLIIGRVGANCGNIKISNGPVWITDNAIFIEKFKIQMFDINFLSYLFFFLNINKYVEFSGQPKITQRPLESINYIIPPLSIQDDFSNFVLKQKKCIIFIYKELEKVEYLKLSLIQGYFIN